MRAHALGVEVRDHDDWMWFWSGLILRDCCSVMWMTFVSCMNHVLCLLFDHVGFVFVWLWHYFGVVLALVLNVAFTLYNVIFDHFGIVFFFILSRPPTPTPTPSRHHIIYSLSVLNRRMHSDAFGVPLCVRHRLGPFWQVFPMWFAAGVIPDGWVRIQRTLSICSSSLSSTRFYSGSYSDAGWRRGALVYYIFSFCTWSSDAFGCIRMHSEFPSVCAFAWACAPPCSSVPRGISQVIRSRSDSRRLGSYSAFILHSFELTLFNQILFRILFRRWMASLQL